MAKRYHTDPQELAELNDLYGDNALSRREEIFVPTKQGNPPGTSRPNRTASSSKPRSKHRETGKQNGPRGARTAMPRGRCGTEGRPCLHWPVKGSLATGYGGASRDHHDGIDIEAPKGTSIQAAADGDVLYSGDEIAGYGNLVIIRHENDIITVYAHNEKNLVKEGERVKARQPIATLGNTGNASGHHLHFEVRVKERPRDPLLYLP